jgi:hypothetical protein
VCLVHLCLQLVVVDPTRRAPDPVEVVCWVATFEKGGKKDWAHQTSRLHCFARMVGGKDVVIDAYHHERVVRHRVFSTTTVLYDSEGTADSKLV